MNRPSVIAVALQDENHRIVDSAGQWMIQHRLEPGKAWANDAFCITRFGVGFFLGCEAIRKSPAGYLPLHHWPVPPRLPAIHPG